MKAQTHLTSHERRMVTDQAGQWLVVIGNLLANESVVRASVSGHVRVDLIKLGRKLIAAGKRGRAI